MKEINSEFISNKRKKAKKRAKKTDEEKEVLSTNLPIKHSWEPIPKRLKWTDQQRVQIISGRNISFRNSHLMNDLGALMPHSKPDYKIEEKSDLEIINENKLMNINEERKRKRSVNSSKVENKKHKTMNFEVNKRNEVETMASQSSEREGPISNTFNYSVCEFQTEEVREFEKHSETEVFKCSESDYECNYENSLKVHSMTHSNLPDKFHNAYQTSQYGNHYPHQLIGLMYRLDLSVLCLLRKVTYAHKYPSLSLAFGDSEMDKFSNIVFRYKEKSIHVHVENVDQYYVDKGISYAEIFAKGKQDFSINGYFNSYVKHVLKKTNSLSNNIELLVIYTIVGLDLTEDKRFKKGRSKKFYPFKFNRINLEECDILEDFLFTNNNMKGRGLYQFSQDKTTREELLKRLEFSSAVRKVIKEKNLSQEGIKVEFLDKLIYAVNQPNRENLNIVIKREIEKNSKIQDNYISLQERILCDITASERYKKFAPGIIYEFNLLMLYLHNLFLHKNMLCINSERKSDDTSNDITFRYKDKITYVKAYNTNSNIGYSQLFPSINHKNAFSINNLFDLFIKELKKDIEYFVIYTSADLDLTEEKILKKGDSKDFHPLKFSSIDIQQKKYKILRRCSCIYENSLYQFVQEKGTRKKLLSLLKLPPYLKKEKLSDGYEKEIKKHF